MTLELKKFEMKKDDLQNLTESCKKSGISIDELTKKIPFLGTLIKKEKDMEMVLEKLKYPT